LGGGGGGVGHPTKGTAEGGDIRKEKIGYL